MAYVDLRYEELSKFPHNFSFAQYVFLNERLTRSGALECLCTTADSDSVDKYYPITLPNGEIVEK